MLEALQGAKHHIHMEYFIIQPDASGKRFLDVLVEKAARGRGAGDLRRNGIVRLHRRFLEPLLNAGGRAFAFLPLAPFAAVLGQMRNHRKITSGGRPGRLHRRVNLGDEYLGEVPRFGFWRDTHLRLEGPAVASLQRVFAEDWERAAHYT